MSLTTDQKNVLIAIERTTASISLVASVILLATYLSLKEFRNLPNTIIFLASPANMLAGIAAIIGGNGLSNERGSLCQAQAFLLEWFMQSDPFWSLVAAVTVFLIFFCRWDAERIKNLYWLYALFCYGVPSISAIVCLFYKKNGPVYGNATLWCWIDQDFAWARIYTYYAPIWTSIILSLSIYIAVGIRVYRSRTQLNAARNHAYYGTERSSNRASSPSILEQAEINNGSRSPSIKYPDAVYSPVSFKSSPPTTPKFDSFATTTNNSPASGSTTLHTRFKSSISAFRQTWKKWKNMDEVKYKYTKCAGLFALSILITWVPASTNRLYGIVHPHGHYIYALNIASAIVLPLQGFWNAFIFFSTSVPIVKMVWGDVKTGRRMMLVGKIFGWQRDMQENTLPLGERRGAVVGMGHSNDSHTRLRGGMRPDDDSFLESS